MGRHFSFRWCPLRTEPTSVLVVASGASDFDKAAVSTVLDEDHRRGLYPDRILLVHPRLAHEAFVERAIHAFGDGTMLRMGANRVPVHSAPFDEEGRCSAFTRLYGPEVAWPEGAFERMKRDGLLEIFRRREVLMLPGPGMHFVHPSGVHSEGFLRGANALVDGAETTFLAMTLLRHLGRDEKRIWVDSSSIASVAHAAVSLRQRFVSLADPPHVDSFSSYDGLRRNGLPHARESLVLISATASGNMARTIARDHNVDARRVINLFSAAHLVDDLTVHCDVSRHASIRRDGGESRLDYFEADACKLCDQGSRIVRFLDDQFLAEATKFTEVMIVEKDAPDGLAGFFERFHDHRLFGLERRDDTDQHRFWVDVQRLDGDAKFEAEIRAAARRFAPVSVSHVVPLDDDGSRWMAGVVADEIGDLLGRRPVTASAASASMLAGATGVVVVAGCVGSGNALQVVSRDLRDVLGDAPRSYVVGFAKQGGADRLEKLRNDLVHSKSHQHSFVALHRIGLPEQDLTAWMGERSLLNLAADRTNDQRWTEFADARLDVLSARRIDGTIDALLDSPVGAPLRLSAGFAFWPDGYEGGAVSQVDVVATIAAVLHNMRVNRPRKGAEAKLASGAFDIAILDPGVFGRYNDGVIQASLLRLAYPHELNYAGRPELSAAMLRIMQRAVERWDAPQGEACLEFLIAMATGRLTLTSADAAKLGRTPLSGDAPTRLVTLLRIAVTRGAQTDDAAGEPGRIAGGPAKDYASGKSATGDRNPGT